MEGLAFLLTIMIVMGFGGFFGYLITDNISDLSKIKAMLTNFDYTDNVSSSNSTTQHTIVMKGVKLVFDSTDALKDITTDANT